MKNEYKEKGDYHRHLDKNWRYYPVYVEKIKYIERILQNEKGKKILDAGCGEGILVEKFAKQGFDIIGLDINYNSKYVKKGNIMKMPFRSENFDVVLCLDVLEHLSFEQQEKTIKEIKRVLKKQSKLIVAVPNLAHLASRIYFLISGKLLRTSTAERHIGDRPISEYLLILKKNNFKIIKRKGIFPTFFLISAFTYLLPSKSLFFHKIYNKLLAYPDWCFENIIICKK